MSVKIEKLLKNQGENYILPFFWQHGEDEATLRKYMQVIHDSNIGAVCVESRPHPDFCGPKWWEDMDVILDEARKRKMQVWILDDSHFPTGYANGAMANQPDERCRQSICCKKYECVGGETLRLGKEELLHPEPFVLSWLEELATDKNPRVFDDDRLLGVYAVQAGERAKYMDLSSQIRDESLSFHVPEGQWKVYVLHLSRNKGYHRNYINMMDKESCKVLLDAVYEPHYARYKDDFGTVIAGFFSDEPEMGNGHLYEFKDPFGSDVDFPWSQELEAEMLNRLGETWVLQLALLWEEEADADKKAKVRYAYMDALTNLVKEDFSYQLGNWCEERGVKYIGHMIEDNNHHSRTGGSLGHFFRGLAGQHMSGIDNIGGQVMPQKEDLDYDIDILNRRIGEFYHYSLGKLGSSAAAIEPRKNGDSMCEIFGNYGWSAGVRLEKYLVDHFLVRGINHYVPHAFSPKEFPDPDCPPHFYAHGHNPQYRHFGSLMAYTNRVCELISGGYHVAPAAVLYHGEGEWTGDYIPNEKIGHILADAQIDYDFVPQDVFAEPKQYHMVVEDGVLKVNNQRYRSLIVPGMQFVTKAFAQAAIDMIAKGIEVLFVNRIPEGVCDVSGAECEKLLTEMGKCIVTKMDDVLAALQVKKIPELAIEPANNRIRYIHYEHADGSAVYMFVNEGTEKYCGKIQLTDARHVYCYDAWENCVYAAAYGGKELGLEIEPLKSQIFIFDTKEVGAEHSKAPVCAQGSPIDFSGEWKRSICASKAYPAFGEAKAIELPDKLAEEEPEFSGFVRYKNTFDAQAGSRVTLEITDAYEGVEVFLNGKSLGIQVVPAYLFDLTENIIKGENHLVIEVATTLERERAKYPNSLGKTEEATCPSGITGEVKLYTYKF